MLPPAGLLSGRYRSLSGTDLKLNLTSAGMVTASTVSRDRELSETKLHTTRSAAGIASELSQGFLKGSQSGRYPPSGGHPEECNIPHHFAGQSEECRGMHLT